MSASPVRWIVLQPKNKIAIGVTAHKGAQAPGDWEIGIDLIVGLGTWVRAIVLGWGYDSVVLPPIAAYIFEAPGLLMFSLVISLPMWMLLGLIVHGPVRMIHEPVSARTWLWRNINAWWEDPVTENYRREVQ